MAWLPKQKTFDGRKILNNLLGYLSANQTAALLWATEGAEVLPDIKSFFKSARHVTEFPSLMVLNSEYGMDFETDLAEIPFSLILEVAVLNGNPDKLSDDSRTYATAIESMLRNCPKTTLFQNNIIQKVGNLSTIETSFDITRTTTGGEFVQIFHIRCEWILYQ